MKTNQVLTRTMGEFSVYQRTSDGMFNATSLLKQWNSLSPTERKMDNFFNLKGTEEFVNTIVAKENLDTPKLVYVKSRASRGLNSGTWMHPLLFVDFAMWINPSFKYDVLKFVYDELIEYRNQAGDSYRKMCERIAQVSNRKDIQKNISKIAEANNIVVYGTHEKMIRNKKANEISMRELVRLQETIIDLVDNEYVKSYEDIRQYLLNTWRKKNQPKELTA